MYAVIELQNIWNLMLLGFVFLHGLHTWRLKVSSKHLFLNIKKCENEQYLKNKNRPHSFMWLCLSQTGVDLGKHLTDIN